MDETNQQTERSEQPSAEPRPWVTPDFKQLTLKEAMTGSPNEYAFDGVFYFS